MKCNSCNIFIIASSLLLKKKYLSKVNIKAEDTEAENWNKGEQEAAEEEVELTEENSTTRADVCELVHNPSD